MMFKVSLNSSKETKTEIYRYFTQTSNGFTSPKNDFIIFMFLIPLLRICNWEEVKVFEIRYRQHID